MRPHTLVVHCSDTTPSMDWGAREIDQLHTDRGWSGIGYHYVIRRNGRLELGRQPWRKGAHVRGHNDGTLAVCLIGGNSGTTPRHVPNYTDEQLTTLRQCIDALDLRVVGHRDVPGVAKACPCFDVAHWYATGEVVDQPRAAT